MCYDKKGGIVWNLMKINSMDITKLKIILATREMARFTVQTAKNENCNAISLKSAESASRSFLDELYLLTKKNNIKIVDIPKNILPLYKLIEQSHLEHKLHAPEIKVTISNKTFA